MSPSGRSSAAQAHPLVRRGLVVSEIAVATVLLVATGLLLRSFLKLQSVDTGFRAENVVAVELSAGYVSAAHFILRLSNVNIDPVGRRSLRELVPPYSATPLPHTPISART